ncbi:LOW QUALITY PROTEIN: ribonuclease h1 [Plakobranchus ocellatus]|uniref:Ribonuclease h1 n=1 Tax=Plakobranchus ocellatus TaxID=259542 RepID=A0AAV4D7N0_9GAST|nr:LOW QUALITY PROTEIN: ribonuclease h1 [Plakobranchus ocellatus]
MRVELCWIPAHCGIQGNEKADGEAKLGLDREHTIQTRIGKTEIKSIINKKMKEEWQNMWDRETKGKFFRKLVPKAGPKKIKFTRQLEPLNRLRMGTTRYKHANRECGYCRKKVTTEHILFQCPGLVMPRNYLRNNMCRQLPCCTFFPNLNSDASHY